MTQAMEQENQRMTKELKEDIEFTKKVEQEEQ